MTEVTTTSDIAIRYRKRNRKKLIRKRWPKLFSLVVESVNEYLDEKVGHSRTGDYSMLKVWFGKGLLRKRLKKGLYRGYKNRKYKIKKKDDQYTIIRMK